MNVTRMKDKGKEYTMRLKDPFSDASAPNTDNLMELVKLLARIAADNDYNELLQESKSSYTGPKRKDPNDAKVVIYSRFSSDMQDEKSIEDQERVCEEYALQHGWTVISKFADRGISGASLHNRAEMQRLLKAAEVGMFDIVLSEALDRVSRDIEDTAKIFKTLTHHEVVLHTLSEGVVDEMHVGLI